MMKNSEWGAVAYLAHSKYGRNGEEVTINNNSNYITGIAGDTVSADKTTATTNKYNTAKGVFASTTANVYGIYDMSGGAWEYVAAGLTADVDSTLKEISGFSEKLVNRYTSENYDDITNVMRYGDAIYETSAKTGQYSWNYDGSYFVNAYRKFLGRGNYYVRDEEAGIFQFNGITGGAASNLRFPSRVYSCSI